MNEEVIELLREIAGGDLSESQATNRATRALEILGVEP